MKRSRKTGLPEIISSVVQVAQMLKQNASRTSTKTRDILKENDTT
jgi:hypothetical protein